MTYCLRTSSLILIILFFLETRTAWFLTSVQNSTMKSRNLQTASPNANCNSHSLKCRQCSLTDGCVFCLLIKPGTTDYMWEPGVNGEEQPVGRCVDASTLGDKILISDLPGNATAKANKGERVWGVCGMTIPGDEESLYCENFETRKTTTLADAFAVTDADGQLRKQQQNLFSSEIFQHSNQASIRFLSDDDYSGFFGFFRGVGHWIQNLFGYGENQEESVGTSTPISTTTYPPTTVPDTTTKAVQDTTTKAVQDTTTKAVQDTTTKPRTTVSDRATYPPTTSPLTTANPPTTSPLTTTNPPTTAPRTTTKPPTTAPRRTTKPPRTVPDGSTYPPKSLLNKSQISGMTHLAHLLSLMFLILY